MAIEDIACHVAELCAAGRDDEAGRLYWADDVVSLEPAGQFERVEGRAAVVAKGEWFSAHTQVHAVTVDGPWIHGDRFVLRFAYDLTPHGSDRQAFDEVALYTVKDAKIVEERFFYRQGPSA